MFKQQFDNQQTIYSTVFVSFLYDTKNFPYKMMFEEGCALKKSLFCFKLQKQPVRFKGMKDINIAQNCGQHRPLVAGKHNAKI